MKAICVTAERRVVITDIPAPGLPPPPGHVLISLDSATITHGDKFFLTRPLPGAQALSADGYLVYGANGAGQVIAIGEGVPERYQNRKVAFYKSLRMSEDSVGGWCEQVQLPYETCLILPDELRARDYCGSFGNALTVYAFLSEIRAAGHKGIIVTAGTSATGLMALAMTKHWNIPAIFLARSTAARETLLQHGATDVLVTTDETFVAELATRAEALGTTAVFDGVGGELLSSIAPALPMNTLIYIYGFLGGAAAISLPTLLIMSKNLIARRFTVLGSDVVRDPQALAAATNEIETLIVDPLFKTRIGPEFQFEEIDQAMSFQSPAGARALLVP